MLKQTRTGLALNNRSSQGTEKIESKGTKALLFEPSKPSQTRWVARRKAALVNAIKLGQIGRVQACKKYALSDEELTTWEKAVSRMRKTRNCQCYGPDQTCAGCAKFFPIQAKLARIALGWTLDEAAKATKVSIRSLTRFEGDEFISPAVMDRLRAAYEAHGVGFSVHADQITLSLIRPR